MNTRLELANDLAVAWAAKGLACARQDRHAEAIAACDRAIGMFEPLVNNRPRLANVLAGAWANKGNALQSLGELTEAIAAYDRATSIRELLINTRPEPVSYTHLNGAKEQVRY